MSLVKRSEMVEISSYLCTLVCRCNGRNWDGLGFRVITSFPLEFSSRWIVTRIAIGKAADCIRYGDWVVLLFGLPHYVPNSSHLTYGLLLVKQWLIKGLSVRWVHNFKIWRPNKISWWKHRISWWWHRIWRRPNKIYQKWLHRISWWWYRIWGRQRIRGPHFWYSGPSCKSCKGSVWYN